MHILITWATGFIWSQLVHTLDNLHHTVTLVTRNKEKARHMFSSKWITATYITREDIKAWILKESSIETVIHLAGAPITLFPWNKKNKDKIMLSRIETTKILVDHLPATCHSFLCGSATWYYPSHPTKLYTTKYINKKSESFLEKVCVTWESEAKKAQSETTRVVHLRTWIVLWPEKMDKMIRQATKWWWWVILWSGQQRMPTISLEERVATCLHVIENQSITWPINMVTKNLTHETYMREIAKELHRPVRWRIPEKILRYFWWEASELVVWSWCISPHWLNQ